MVPRGAKPGARETLCECVCETETAEYLHVFFRVFNRDRVSLCVCMCVVERRCGGGARIASPHSCVNPRIRVLHRMCVSAHLCVIVCGHLLYPSPPVTSPSHTQVCPSVLFYIYRQRQGVKRGEQYARVLRKMCVFYFFVYACVLLTAHPPDGSCEVLAYNCVWKCLFWFNKVSVSQIK